MAIKTETANSVQEFIDIVGQLRDIWSKDGYFDPWFRGQSGFDLPLQPNIFRYDLIDDEEGIRGEFLRRAAQFMTEPTPQDEWGWYFLMQHYGAPTRLLDWTDSALVALFFAVNSNHPNRLSVRTDAVVWVLDPWWLNKKAVRYESILLSDWDLAKRYLPRLFLYDQLRVKWPAAIDPPFIARRVAVQHSHFKIFGRDENGLVKLGNRPGGRLARIKLPRKKIDRFRQDLATCGIADTTVYPDLKGLSDELTRYYSSDW